MVYRFLSGFVLIVFSLLPAISQTKISGTVNTYAKVLSIEGTDGVRVDDNSGFKDGDTVLVIQMKGAEYMPVKNDKGHIHNQLQNIANTGRYEFIAIQTVSGNLIKFRSNFLNPYDPAQAVQLVRVPSYQYANVTGADLTCPVWNGNKGGVLALIATDTLLLNANIDASGKGFRGAGKTSGTSNCYILPEQRNYTDAASDSAGLKGESLASILFSYTRGRGELGIAGGGGNSSGSGGGGGGGYGQGGYGGNFACTSWSGTEEAGIGGLGANPPVDYYGRKGLDKYRDRIFMGGGGGAGRGTQNSDVTEGGNGGGIVFLVTYHLKTNGKSIMSDGADVSITAVNNAGSGGGGGGGSVILAAEKITGDTTVSLNGGHGGNSNSCSGLGGGGGGGFLWISGHKFPVKGFAADGGDPGLTIPVTDCRIGQSNGSPGSIAGELDPIFNGFLFNMIISHSDTICYGETPAKLKATIPRGGGGSYTFQWQSRHKPNQVWTNIPGATDTTYSAPALYDTTYFRRIVTSPRINDPDKFTVDTSKSIVINVVPEIKMNVIVPDTIVCKGLNPVKIRGSVAYGGDVKSAIRYLWEESSDQNSWSTVSGTYKEAQSYSEPSNLESRYYRRKVFNNICTVISNPVKITILNRISGNILSPAQTICSGSIPLSLHGNLLSGGDGSYHYKWQQSIDDSLHWTNIGTSESFSPGALTDTMFYRRFVYSGLNETCIDTSKALQIVTLSRISNNIISGQTICSGNAPASFVGSSPSGGDKTYRYSWQLSEDSQNWTAITSASLKDYSHGVLTSTTLFRRIVGSGLNDCCKDTSVVATVTVQPAIQNNVIGSSQTICFGQSPKTLEHIAGPVNGGDNSNYTYQWQKHVYNTSVWTITSGVSTNYQPGGLTDTMYFRCRIASGVCESYSNAITVKVLATLVNNTITGNPQVCELHIPEKLTGGIMSGGSGDFRYTWQDSIVGGTWQNISGGQSADYSSGMITQPTFFRRTVKSGLNDCCISNSEPFLISINQQPKDPEAGENQKLIYKFSTMMGAPLPLTGTGIWTSKSDGPVIADVSKENTTIDNLSLGKNVFFWTITNGVCPSITDSVVVEVEDVVRYTGFSPNNDGKNDYFVIEGLENAKIKELKVFTRWGTEVYSSGNYQNDWDGTGKHGEKLPDDTYYYILNADNHVHKGFVVIRR